MKKFLCALVFSFISIVSVSANAADESICDAKKENFTTSEIVACNLEILKSNGQLKLVTVSITQKAADMIAFIIEARLGIDISDAIVVQHYDDAFTSMNKQISENIDYLLAYVFGLVFLVGSAIMLTRGVSTGVFIDKSVAPFLNTSLILCALAATGNYSFLMVVLNGVFWVLGIFIWVMVILPIFGDMAGDVKAEQSGFSMKADDLADSAVDSMIAAYIQDLTARKGLLVETGQVNRKYNGYEIKDTKFQKCLSESIAPDYSYKSYTLPEIEITQKCAFKELAYEEYQIASINDEKSNNLSGVIIDAIHSNRPEALQIASLIIGNVCGSVYEVEDDLDTDYVSICLDMNTNGLVKMGDDGLANTIKSSAMVDNEEIQERITALKSRIAAVALNEALKQANTVERTVVDNISPDNVIAAFSLGDAYRKAYAAAGSTVFDIEFINEVAIRKSTFKQALGIEENLDVLGGNGTNNNFGLADFIEKFKVKGSLTKDLVGVLNHISGSSANSLGFEYRDCFQKGNCNEGSSNILTPLNKASGKMISFLGSLYVGSKAFSMFYEKKAEALPETDPDRKYYYAKSFAWNGFSLKLLGLIAVMLIAYFAVYRGLMLNYVRILIEAIAQQKILPVMFAFAFIFGTTQRFYADDGESFNTALKKYGVWDAVLRIPLIMIGWACGLMVLNITLPLTSIVLNAVYGSPGADEIAGDLWQAISYTFFYTVCYIASFHVACTVSYQAITEGIEKLSYNGATYTQNTLENFQSSMGKVISMAKR